MSKKKEEWNPSDTMSEEYMKSIKSDVDFGNSPLKICGLRIFRF